MRAKVVFLVIEFKFSCVFHSFDNFCEVGNFLRSQNHLNEITFDGFCSNSVALGICGCFDIDEMEFWLVLDKQFSALISKVKPITFKTS